MSPVAMITFTSDFGTRYAAAVRGALLAVSDERVVDVTHDLPRWSVVGAAFWVDQLLRGYPAGVHLIAVDPGRGASTETVIGVVGEHRLVGPDTGVCWPVAQTLARRTGASPSWYLHRADPSPFPTRDVRAPLAGALAADPSDVLGTVDRIDTPTRLRLPEGALTEEGATGEVITTDRFGNVITSIPAAFAEAAADTAVLIGGAMATVVGAHSAPETGALVVTVGEHGRIELVLGGASAADRLGIGPGDPLRIQRV